MAYVTFTAGGWITRRDGKTFPGRRQNLCLFVEKMVKIFGVKSDRKSENSWCKSTKVTVIWTKPSPLQSGAPVQTKSRYVDEDSSNVTMVFEVHKTLAIAEGSLEVKLPTIWTDGKCRGGKSQRREEERREEKRKIRRKKSRRERVRRRCRCAKR